MHAHVYCNAGFSVIGWQTYGTSVGCNGGDDEHEVEGDDELQCKRRPVGPFWKGDASMHVGMKDPLECKRGCNGT